MALTDFASGPASATPPSDALPSTSAMATRQWAFISDPSRLGSPHERAVSVKGDVRPVGEVRPSLRGIVRVVARLGEIVTFDDVGLQDPAVGAGRQIGRAAEADLEVAIGAGPRHGHESTVDEGAT